MLSHLDQLLKVSVSDFKLIFRDSSLRVFLALPILIFVVILLFLPYLAVRFPGLSDYIAPVLVVSAIQVSQMFCLIYSMVLIDEKETEVAKVYGILPVSKPGFALLRLLIPVLITVALTWLLLLIQPFYELPWFPALLISGLSGIITPVYVLTVAIRCKNKMQGLVWVKIFNLIIVLPAVAFFIPESFSYLFSIFPTHWLFQSLHNLILGGPYLLHLMIGLVFIAILTTVALRTFTKVHYA